MIGIGHRQEKLTKMRILAEKSKSYNEKYDQLIAQGLDPQEVASILQKEEYQKRHMGSQVEEPYKTSSKINQIGGAVHMGYDRTHQTLTETQTLYSPLQGVVQQQKKTGSSGFNFGKTKQEAFQQAKVIQRIQKDHVGQNFGIDLGQVKTTDYKRHFNDDDKMKDIRANKDKQYNQRKNQLNWYVQTYIKTKDSLRKC